MGIKEMVLNAYREGKVAFMTPDGLATTPMAEFIKQPSEGILYDLNRDECTLLTRTDDIRWVNDYAAAQVIHALKNKIDELDDQLKQ